MTEEIVRNAIEGRRTALHDLSRYLWEHPEIAFEETLAHDYLTDFLEKEGFQVQRNYLLPTAFRAEFAGQGGAGPTVAFCCEYDALPEIGHGCGHNLIAESTVAAGIAVKEAMKSNSKIAGKVIVMGTPAEESANGKEILLDKGGFAGIDAALMAHPGSRTVLRLLTNARIMVKAKFKGLCAHAGSRPWEGVNALDAAVGAYVNVSMLRQQMKPTWRAHGIFSKGGTAPNIIPDESELSYMVRAPTAEELEELYEKVERCFRFAAAAAGCQVTTERSDKSLNIVPNSPLVEAYKKHAQRQGFLFEDPTNEGVSTGASSDMGNVSQVIPSIHPTFRIETEGNNHTAAFTKSAGSEKVQEPTLKAAAALALTALDILTDPELLQEAKRSFEETFHLKLQS